MEENTPCIIWIDARDTYEKVMINVELKEMIFQMYYIDLEVNKHFKCHISFKELCKNYYL